MPLGFDGLIFRIDMARVHQCGNVVDFFRDSVDLGRHEFHRVLGAVVSGVDSSDRVEAVCAYTGR